MTGILIGLFLKKIMLFHVVFLFLIEEVGFYTIADANYIFVFVDDSQGKV